MFNRPFGSPSVLTFVRFSHQADLNKFVRMDLLEPLKLVVLVLHKMPPLCLVIYTTVFIIQGSGFDSFVHFPTLLHTSVFLNGENVALPLVFTSI